MNMLTRSQFENACKAFISKYSGSVIKSPATDALIGWSWSEHHSVLGFGYMSRKAIHSWRSWPISTDHCVIEEGLEEMLFEEYEITTMESDAQECLVSQQYVVYSDTFQVPVFYFTIHDSKGSPLSLSNLIRTSLFHPFAFEGTEATSFGLTWPASSFPLLSQGEHPTLGTPCWYLHPCETTNSVNELISEFDHTDKPELELIRWLEVWFMLVGTVINSRT